MVMAEEYLQQLWLMQDGNTPTKAIILPSDEPICEIDLNTRTIKPPSFLSVKQDHYAEVVYFLVDRFFGEIDLSTMGCIVQYRNKQNGAGGFYPVPFYDITSYSSLVTNQYLKAHINSGTYEPNVYYLKSADDEYVLSGAPYNPSQTYYVKNDLSLNRKYIIANDMDETTYRPNLYYYIDNSGTIVELTSETYVPNKYYVYNALMNTYELDSSDRFDLTETYYDLSNSTFEYKLATGPYDPDETYYVSIDKRALKAQVEYSNYKRDTYYYLNENNELVLATGNFEPSVDYYILVDKPKMLFPWLVSNEATGAAGELEFSIRFYGVDNDSKTLNYNMTTLAAKSKILDTMEPVAITDEEFDEIKDTPSGVIYEQLGREATILEDLYYKIAAKNDIYWLEAY